MTSAAANSNLLPTLVCFQITSSSVQTNCVYPTGVHTPLSPFSAEQASLSVQRPNVQYEMVWEILGEGSEHVFSARDEQRQLTLTTWVLRAKLDEKFIQLPGERADAPCSVSGLFV